MRQEQPNREHNRLEEWQSEVERKMEEAVGDGNTAHLPGAGKPLKLDDYNPYVPDDLRVAFKLMRDNGIAPAWVMEQRELRALRRDLKQRVRRAVTAYRGGLGDAKRLSGEAATDRRRRVEAAWFRARKAIHADAEAFNKRVLIYNLKLPPGVRHLVLFDVEKAFEQALRR